MYPTIAITPVVGDERARARIEVGELGEAQSGRDHPDHADEEDERYGRTRERRHHPGREEQVERGCDLRETGHQDAKQA
jgi:hypothetical protein